MPFVYILRCPDNSYYTGSTVSAGKRLFEPDYIMSDVSVKIDKPIEFVYVEECSSIPDCLLREKEILKWPREKKEALINSSIGKLIETAKRRK